MNPKTIGDYRLHEPVTSQLVPGIIFRENNKVSIENLDEKKSEIDEKQNILEQDFLLNPCMTVGQIVMDHEIVLLDFVRYECGET